MGKHTRLYSIAPCHNPHPEEHNRHAQRPTVCLEGWYLYTALRDAPLRSAPQDEGRIRLQDARTGQSNHASRRSLRLPSAWGPGVAQRCSGRVKKIKKTSPPLSAQLYPALVPVLDCVFAGRKTGIHFSWQTRAGGWRCVAPAGSGAEALCRWSYAQGCKAAQAAWSWSLSATVKCPAPDRFARTCEVKSGGIGGKQVQSLRGSCRASL